MKYLTYINNSPFLSLLAFYALLVSGAYIILLWSPNVVGDHLSSNSKIIIYILPWLMLWLVCAWDVITERARRLEIILIILIIIIGIVNIYLSDSPSKSLSPMRTFLLTGVFALWYSMFLLAGQQRRWVFDWFCFGCLAIIVPVEIIWWLIRDINFDGVFNIFIPHPIPLGTLIILLSPGPIFLLTSKNFKIKMSGLLIGFSALTLIFLTHKRGTWLAIAAMLIVGIITLARRRKFLLAALVIIMTLIFTAQGRRLYARLDPNIPHYASILQRLELYNFALHIWESHPLMGIGLRTLTHANYLKDYQQQNQNLVDFPQSVTKLQTFDNMALTGFVELGSLMTLTYLGLVIVILTRYIRALSCASAATAVDWYRLLVIIGLAIHSMSYDSLMCPPVNWLFHVQLGIMAGYYASDVALGSVSRQTLVAA